MKPIAIYPPALQQKVLAQEAPGGIPVALSIVIPSVTRPSEPFEVSIAVLDANGYPTLKCIEHVQIKTPEGGRTDIAFRTDLPAVGRLGNIQLPTEGLFRLSASCGNLETHSNPTLCTSEEIPAIYWGDPHVHTILSNCHPDKCRSLNFCYTAARYLSALDWVAAADHVSNGRCDFSKWKEQQTVSNLYDDPEAFVTLPAYEASLQGGAGGDNNVYMSRWPDMYADEYGSGNTKTLCHQLADKLQTHEFFIVPHHTTRTGKHGEISDDIYPGPGAMPVMEVHSKWGTSEYRGNSNALKSIHNGPSYARDLLNRGLKLGFVAGTDSHATMPSGGGEEPGHIDRLPGLTAVSCRELTRQSVFDALRLRQCYAASLERIIMHGSIAGYAFGQEARFADLSTPPEIDVIVAAKSNIVQIDLVRNGETIHTITPEFWNARFTYKDEEGWDQSKIESTYLNGFVYYYLRVSCESGAQAWSSPVWIRD
jgi:hypothetical protein